MNTKEQIEQCIKSLGWLKFNIVGTEEPKKNTFEYATKLYLENAIALLKDSAESDEVLDIIIKKGVDMQEIGFCKDFEDYKSHYENYDEIEEENYLSWHILTETEFKKIKERLVK